MKAKLAKLCCIGLICLFAVGLILLVAAPSFGEGAGQRAIEANGGVMDTATYQRAITTTTDTYQMCIRDSLPTSQSGSSWPRSSARRC